MTETMKPSLSANRRGFLAGCKPDVERFWLLLAAGATWSVVGLVLAGLACYWLSQSVWPWNAVVALAGFACGVLVYLFGFGRIARRYDDEAPYRELFRAAAVSAGKKLGAAPHGRS